MSSENYARDGKNKTCHSLIKYDLMKNKSQSDKKPHTEQIFHVPVPRQWECQANITLEMGKHVPVTAWPMRIIIVINQHINNILSGSQEYVKRTLCPSHSLGNVYLFI